MVGLILVSIVMLALGIAMAIIFFKQLPLYRQIKFIAKMPNVKYKEYSQQAKKSVIVWSIIAYIITIAFSVFALIVVYRSGVSANYLWILATLYFVVLGLSIASMVLMFVKIAQLSKIRKTLKENEKYNNSSNKDVDENHNDNSKNHNQMISEEVQTDANLAKKRSTGANADISGENVDENQQNISKLEEEQYLNGHRASMLEKDKFEISQGNKNISKNVETGETNPNLNSNPQYDGVSEQSLQIEQNKSDDANFERSQSDSNTSQNVESTQPSIVVNIPEQNKEEKQSIGERLFTDGIFELGDQLVKLRELHVSGLISNEEYTMLREKWIDAVLSEPLFGKKRTKNKNKTTSKPIANGEIIDQV